MSNFKSWRDQIFIQAVRLKISDFLGPDGTFSDVIFDQRWEAAVAYITRYYEDISDDTPPWKIYVESQIEEFFWAKYMEGRPYPNPVLPPEPPKRQAQARRAGAEDRGSRATAEQEDKKTAEQRAKAAAKQKAKETAEQRVKATAEQLAKENAELRFKITAMEGKLAELEARQECERQQFEQMIENARRMVEPHTTRTPTVVPYSYEQVAAPTTRIPDRTAPPPTPPPVAASWGIGSSEHHYNPSQRSHHNRHRQPGSPSRAGRRQLDEEDRQIFAIFAETSMSQKEPNHEADDEDHRPRKKQKYRS